MLRGRFIAIQAYLKKQEKKQINNLILHLKQLEKEEIKNSRVSRRKEIIKIRAEINEKETKETTAKINKAKSWFFEKINKIGKPLARLIKKKREKNRINKIRNESGEIIKIQAEINEKEIKVKIDKTKSWFFEKINKTDKPLARLSKRKREKNQINKIRNEKGEVTMQT